MLEQICQDTKWCHLSAVADCSLMRLWSGGHFSRNLFTPSVLSTAMLVLWWTLKGKKSSRQGGLKRRGLLNGLKWCVVIKEKLCRVAAEPSVSTCGTAAGSHTGDTQGPRKQRRCDYSHILWLNQQRRLLSIRLALLKTVIMVGYLCSAFHQVI